MKKHYHLLTISDWPHSLVCYRQAECLALQQAAKRDLDSILPELQHALDCLTKLRTEHIREVKSMGKPPPGVLLTMEALCVVFRKEKHDWDASRELLKDPGRFKESLLAYDKDNIPEEVAEKIETYTARDDFDPTQIRKASVACEAMCLWVRAMGKYHAVLKEVRPVWICSVFAAC